MVSKAHLLLINVVSLYKRIGFQNCHIFLCIKCIAEKIITNSQKGCLKKGTILNFHCQF